MPVGQELTSLIPAQSGIPELIAPQLNQPEAEGLGGIRLPLWANFVHQWVSRELVLLSSTGLIIVCLTSAGTQNDIISTSTGVVMGSEDLIRAESGSTLTVNLLLCLVALPFRVFSILQVS